MYVPAPPVAFPHHYFFYSFCFSCSVLYRLICNYVFQKKIMNAGNLKWKQSFEINKNIQRPFLFEQYSLKSHFHLPITTVFYPTWVPDCFCLVNVSHQLHATLQISMLFFRGIHRSKKHIIWYPIRRFRTQLSSAKPPMICATGYRFIGSIQHVLTPWKVTF